MIQTLCRNCNEVFCLPVIMWAAPCPYCGSHEIYVAIWNEDTRECQLPTAISRWLAVPIPIRADCDRFID